MFVCCDVLVVFFLKIRAPSKSTAPYPPVPSTTLFLALRRLGQAAVTPTAIEDFITVVEMDLGFGLYRAVSDAKTALSAAERTELRFDMEGVTIRESISRRDFEGWIAPELAQIDAALAQVFSLAGLAPAAVDQVRSEERRVGKACVRTCRSRGSPNH